MATTLTIDFITSLDGFGAAEGWPGWWGLESDEYLEWLSATEPSTQVMGSRTYRLMSQLVADGEPGTEVLTGMRKLVFSNSLTEPLQWANSELVSGDAVEAVRRLRETETTPLSTLGSLSLCRSLLASGLVDLFRVVVFPVITGATGSDRIYDGYPDVMLTLTTSRTFSGGLQLLEYEPRVLDGPPGGGPSARV